MQYCVVVVGLDDVRIIGQRLNFFYRYQKRLHGFYAYYLQTLFVFADNELKEGLKDFQKPACKKERQPPSASWKFVKH